MANQEEIKSQYDYFGAIHELRLESPKSTRDYTCALFNGNKNLTLDEAQKAKHEWILKGVKFKEGNRVLDIGCGWGPILETVTKKGGNPLGLTLSPHQENYCKKKGFNVLLQDYKTIDKKKIGKFDAIISVGAFEHFCSMKEYEEGKQEQIYKEFFKFCYDLLPKGGRLYLQTMTWGDHTPKLKGINSKAKGYGRDATIYRLTKFYPGSWLPNGLEQMVKIASPYFKFKGSNNGRKDYIITLDKWGKSTKNLLKLNKLFRVLPIVAKILIRAIYQKDTRSQISSIKHNDQQRCFINNWMSHERMFFEKK